MFSNEKEIIELKFLVAKLQSQLDCIHTMIQILKDRFTKQQYEIIVDVLNGKNFLDNPPG